MNKHTKKIVNLKGGINLSSLPQSVDDNDLINAYNILPDKSTIRPRFGTELINNEYLNGKIYTTFEHEDSIYIHCERGLYNLIIRFNIATETFQILKQFETTSNRGTFFVFNSDLFFKNDKVYLNIYYDKNTSQYVADSVYDNVRIPVIANRIKVVDNVITEMLEYEYINKMTNKYNARYDLNREEPSTEPIILPLIYDYKKYENKAGFNAKNYIKVKVIDLVSGTYLPLSDNDYNVKTIYKYDNITKTYNYITFIEITDKPGVLNGYDVFEVEAYLQIDEYEDNDKKNNTIEQCDIAIVYNNSVVFASSNTTDKQGFVYFSEPLQPNYFPENAEFNRIIGGAKSSIKGFGIMDNDLMVFTSYEIYGVDAMINDNGTTSYKVTLVNSGIGLSNMYSIKQYNNNIIFIYKDELYMTLRYNTTGQKGVAKIDTKIDGLIKKKITNSEHVSAYIVKDSYFLVLNDSGDVLVLSLDNLAYMYKENMYYMYKQIIFWLVNIPNCSTFLNAGNGVIYIGLNISSSLIKSNKTYVDYNGEKFDFEYQTKAFDFGNNSVYKFIESLDIVIPNEIDIRDDLLIKYNTDIFNVNESYILNLNQDIVNFQRPLNIRTHLRNVRYFSITFKNIIVDEIYIKYNLTTNNR